MANLFEENNKKQALKNKLYFYAFYTVLLFLLALLIIISGKGSDICISNYFCANTKTQILKASFILYLYLLFFVIIMIQTYKLLEKLIAKKNHIKYFKYIFYALTPFVLLVVWLAGTRYEDAQLMVVFTAIISIAGLMLIEFRKKE
jgi:C4-dicarboxylate transporter